jgi:hypothetical protein
MTRGTITAGPPANPSDGDIWIATDVLPGISGGSAGASGNTFGPCTWMFQYDADYSLSANKWQFIGGPPLMDYRAPGGGGTDTASLSAATWGSVATEPGVYMPRSGEYVLEFGVNQIWTTPTANTEFGAGYYNALAVAQNTPSDVLSAWPGSDGTYKAGMTKWPAAIPNVRDGYVLYSKQNGAGAQNVTLGFRWIMMTPIRII